MNADTQAAVFESAAVEAAHAGGDVLRRRFRDKGRLRVEKKGLHDFVTEVDRESEAAVLRHLRGLFPDHAILAEEGAPSTGEAAFRWIVDPLDGTTNFIHGVPTFCVSVALEDASGLLVGAIFDPVHDETFRASRGGGAWLGADRIACSHPSGAHEALFATGFPFREMNRLDRYLRSFSAFARMAAGVRRAGSAALDLAFTACGRYDGFWEIGLSSWDMAAGALLVREAGGIVTDVSGGPGFLSGGSILAAGPELHATMLAVTKAAFDE